MYRIVSCFLPKRSPVVSGFKMKVSSFLYQFASVQAIPRSGTQVYIHFFITGIIWLLQRFSEFGI